MTTSGEYRCWTFPHAVSAAFVIAIVIVLSLLAKPSAQAQTLKVLHTFKGAKDGANSYAGLVRDSVGNLYGTTSSGGVGFGTVFKLDKTGKETVLYSFTDQVDGAYPAAAVIRDAVGSLYGTTLSSASGTGGGTVFKLDPTGKLITLHSFTGSPDGANPLAGLLSDKAGNLYGTTYDGGTGCSAPGCGTVFKLDKNGKETVLYNFKGGASDGAGPEASMIRDASGNLYGTTFYGDGVTCNGSDGVGCGTVFKLNKTGKETVLYRFAGGFDGENPTSALVLDAAGNLYGTTYSGQPLGFGVVFMIDKSGKETVLHTFAGHPDGTNPQAGLVRDSAGNFYGTTANGGILGCALQEGCGTIFKVDKNDQETVLYSFTGGADGANPMGGLVQDAHGNLYGTAYAGGTGCGGLGCGVVFKLTP
jgi:uncharacterized repeat protein (TIGR03803 family)